MTKINEANYNHGFGDDKPERTVVMPYNIHDKHKREFMHVYNTKLGGNKTSHARSLAYNHAIRHIGDTHGSEVRDAFEKYYKHSTLNGHTNEEETYMSEEILDEATRKHFRAAAEAIKSIEDPAKRKEHASIHADIYAKQNPRFDRAKFMKAAGVNEDFEYDIDEGNEDHSHKDSLEHLKTYSKFSVHKAIVHDGDGEANTSYIVKKKHSNKPSKSFETAEEAHRYAAWSAKNEAVETIVDAAMLDTPVDVKDAFAQTIADRIASRVAEIRDEKRTQIFVKPSNDA